MTGIAIDEDTARSAKDLGFGIVVVSDAMSARPTEEHDASPRTVFSRLGRVPTTQEYLDKLI